MGKFKPKGSIGLFTIRPLSILMMPEMGKEARSRTIDGDPLMLSKRIDYVTDNAYECGDPSFTFWGSRIEDQALGWHENEGALLCSPNSSGSFPWLS
jgi:hypothetical protein